MHTLKEMAEEFLSQKRIAVAGVSRSDKASPANLIYHKLRSAGREVFAVNPRADAVEGEPCYHDLKSIPVPVDLVVVAAPAHAAEEIVGECAELGIRRIWFHRAFGAGSVSKAAVEFCRKNNIAVIPGACPMMFCQPVDFGHRCMRWVLKLTGGLPTCRE